MSFLLPTDTPAAFLAVLLSGGAADIATPLMLGDKAPDARSVCCEIT
jgi:hypothetical protein